MIDKVLNIKLNYKGKNLDIAKYERDFKNQFYIGSNKHLLWQVLDPTFPDKFLLVQHHNNDFILNLRQGMEVKVRKGEQLLDTSTLIQERMIRGNQLLLTQDTTGSINFSQYWEIAYEFQVPYRHELTEEQRQVIRQYSRRAEPTTEYKFSRNIIIAGIIFTIVSLYLFNMLYKPKELENTLQNRLAASAQMAQLVTPEIPLSMQQEFALADEKGKAAKVVPVSKGTAVKGNANGAGQIESRFGFNPNAVGSGNGVRSARVIALTTERDLVAEGLGGGGGGGGKGTGGGGGKGNGTGVGSGISGGGSHGATAFNISPTGKRTQNMGELFTGNINVTGAHGYKEIDASALGGKTGKIEAQRIVSSSQIGSVRSRFVSAGIVPVKETEIATSPPEVKAEMGNVRSYVSAYKPQLQNLYLQESQIRDMYGALEFTIYINQGGAIAGVDIKTKAGSYFTDSFLQKAKSVIEKWKIPVNKPVIYTFSWQFIKN
jgi:hypothetical protein